MANLVRRVRTPGGSVYFGLPIGAIITADARAAAKAKQGGKPAPKGSTVMRVAKGGGFNGQKPTNTKKAVTAQANEVAKAKEVLGTKGKAPGGPVSVSLNGTQHAFPEGTQVARSKKYPNRIAYAKTPDGRIFRMADEHIDEPQGEAKIGIAQAFNGGGNDIIDAPKDISADDYDPINDPNEAPYTDVADFGEGETLTNASGMKSFTKTGENEWSDSKGFKIDDTKMQALVDLGSFGQGGKEIPDFVDEPTNLYEVLGEDADLEDFEEYLDGLPNGQKVTTELGESFTKTEGGDGADTWTNDETGETVDNGEIASIAPLVTVEKTPDTGVDSTPLEENENGNAGADAAGTGDDSGEPAVGAGTGGDDAGAADGDADAAEPAQPVEGTPVARPERFDALEAQGKNVLPVIELDPKKDAQRFADAIESTKERMGALAAAVYVYPTEEYADMRLFLDKEGKAGFALKGDDIVSVFNAHDPEDTTKKGVGRSLIAQAVQEGGRRLDAFDDVLPKIYAQEGFVPAARMKFNEEFAPEGWDYDDAAIKALPNDGKPDVVFMAYDPKSLDKKYGEHLAEGKGGNYFDDYDAAVDAQVDKAQELSNGKDGEDEESEAAEPTMEELVAARNEAQKVLAAAKAQAIKNKTGTNKNSYMEDPAVKAANDTFVETQKAISTKVLADLKAKKAAENEGLSEVEIAEKELDAAKKDAANIAKSTQTGSALQSQANDNVKAKQAKVDALKAQESSDPETAEVDAALKALDEAQAKKAAKAPAAIDDPTKQATLPPKKTSVAKVTTPKKKSVAVAEKPQAPDTPLGMDEEIAPKGVQALVKHSPVGAKITLKPLMDSNPDSFKKIGDNAWQDQNDLDFKPFSDKKLAQYIGPEADIESIQDEDGIEYTPVDAMSDALDEESYQSGDAVTLDKDEDKATEPTPEVTDPKKVAALRDTFEEPWMAKEKLSYGKGDLDEKSIKDAPEGRVYYHRDKDGNEHKWVRLPNGDWFDGENSIDEADMLDLFNDDDQYLANPNEVDGYKGIANDVPEKKSKKKDDSKKTYADKMVDENKGKTFSVGTEDKYGDQKFAAVTDEDGALQLLVNGTPLTTEEVKQAYKALNTHTSTHVTYGLYTLPSEHPLAENGLINQFRDTALLRYPNSKPKAAALLTLKEAGNIQDAPILAPKGKKILVGDFLNKSINVQGPAYGFFSIDDLHDSVAVLEHLNDPDIKGKMFKGALTFNLNAVGNIDPSKIIVNGKDKDENRQKFIAYLKNVLDTSALVPTTEQYVARLDMMKPGHKVTTRQGTVYTKTPEGVWKTSGEDGALSSGSLYAKHKQALTFFSQTPSDVAALGQDKRIVTFNADGNATLFKRDLQGKWVKVFDDSDKGEKKALTDAQIALYDAREVFTFTTDNEDIASYDPNTGEAIYYDAEAEDAAVEAMLDEVDKVLAGEPDADPDIVITDKNIETEDASYLAALAPGSAAVVKNTPAPAWATTFFADPEDDEEQDDIFVEEPGDLDGDLTPEEEAGWAALTVPVDKVYIKDGAGNWVEDKRGPSHQAILDSPNGTKAVAISNGGYVSAIFQNNGSDVMLGDQMGTVPMSPEFFKNWKFSKTAFLGDTPTQEDLDAAPAGSRIVLDMNPATVVGQPDEVIMLQKGDGTGWYNNATGDYWTSQNIAETGNAKTLLASLPVAVPDSQDKPFNTMDDLAEPQVAVFLGPNFPGNAYVIANQDFQWAKTYGADGKYYSGISESAMASHLKAAHEDAAMGFYVLDVDAEEMETFVSGTTTGSLVTIRNDFGVALYSKGEDGKWRSQTEPGYIADEDVVFFGKKGNTTVSRVTGLITSVSPDYLPPVKTSDDLVDENDSVVVESEPISLKAQGDSTVAQASNEAYLQEQTDLPDSLAPGKYSTENGGAAYMIVHDDGTGTYVQKNGTKKKLTAAAVKKNHTSGMTKFHGAATDDDLNKAPASAADKAEAKKAATKSVKDFALDDGTYYLGDPSKASSVIFVTKDGETKSYKPITQHKFPTGTDWSGKTINATYKVNETAYQSHWFRFPEGSEWTFNVPQGYDEWVKPEYKGVNRAVRTADGVDIYADDKKVGSLTTDQLASNGLFRKALLVEDEKGGAYGWGVYPITKKIGEGAEEKSTKPSKAYLQKHFLSGALTDKYGNSILPEGHTGSVSFFGTMTDMPTLLELKKNLDSGEWTIDNISSAITTGYMNPWSNPQKIALDPVNLNIYAKDVMGENVASMTSTKEQVEARQKAFMDHLNSLTEGVSIEIPTADAAKYFEYDSFGAPKKPLPTNPSEYGGELAWYSKTGDYSKYIKQISDVFGGGGIIGLHYTSMSIDQKKAWVEALDNGNFAKMYEYEMLAAAKKGKAHDSGYRHPGYKSNVETHQVKWGAAVEGESLASESIDGDWSTNYSYASMEEIDNYLILAQMQNPTFLNADEKRMWYHYHRNSNQKQVDDLSVKALIRSKVEGATPLTAAPVWTDDVKPGKSYNTLFDSTPHPTSWNSTQAYEYIEDNPELKEKAIEWYLKEYPHMQHHVDSKGYDVIGGYEKAAFMGAHMQALKDEAYALSLIPVYTRKEKQTLPKSANATAEYVDQFGKEYIFKPRDPNSGKGEAYEKYRAEIEHAGNLLGRAFGLSTPESTLETLDTPEYGMAYGQMQKRLPNIVGEMLNGFDFGGMSKQMMVDLAIEHMFDYMTSQDDTHGGNALITDKGRVIGIDKGRVFRDPGRWNGLTTDPWDLNTNANTVYASMYSAIKDGKYTKEELDAVYFAARARVRRMQKINDDKLAAIIEDGFQNMPKIDMSYATVDGKKVSNDVEGLKEFFFDRKNNLAERFDTLWTELYNKSGYDALPEKTEEVVEGINTGISNPEHLAAAYESKAKGVSTMVASSQIVGGSVLSWTETTPEGKTQIASQFFLSPGKQKEFMAALTPHLKDAPEQKATPGAYSSDVYWDSIMQGAKTVNGHAADGQYNQARIAGLEAARDKIEMDLAGFQEAVTKPSTTQFGVPVKKFPSGVSVPEHDLAQYRLMLDEYSGKIKTILDGKAKQEKVGKIAQYVPVKANPNLFYSHTDGTTVTPIEGEDKFLKWDGKGNASVVDPDDADVLSALSGIAAGWSSSAESPAAAVAAPSFTVVRHKKTHDKTAQVDDDSNKVMDGGTPYMGAPGAEYEVTLATGERIYFRNADSTGTVRSQQGQVTLHALADNPEEAATALERLSDALSEFRVPVDVPATEESMENAYWGEMFNILQGRVGGTGTWAKAQKKFQALAAEQGVNPDSYLDYLHGNMELEERNEFWRSFYVEFFPTEVEEMLENKWYRPRFARLDPSNVDTTAGRPTWLRLDWRSEYEEILASGKNITKTGRILKSTSGIDTLLKAGGWSSAEDIFRKTGGFGNNAASPTSDQDNGATHYVWTRATKGFSNIGDSLTSWRLMLHPSALLRTRNYALKTDSYGSETLKKSQAHSAISKDIKANSGSSNEVLIAEQASFMDDVEIAVMPTAQLRDYIIQEFKKRGITQIRGVDIEDRFVLSSTVEAAYAKIRPTWAEWTPDAD